MHLSPTLGVLALALGLASSGCLITESGGSDSNGPQDTPPVQPMQVPIDADATLTAMAGAGVGVFVEYATGGHWTVFTSCDTTTSGQPCAFDVYLSPLDQTATVSNVQGQALEGRDIVEIANDGSAHLYAETSTGLDGITFDATPGSSFELLMGLDGTADPRFIYWVGKAVLHNGAPTDPLDLVPSAP